VKRGSLTLWVSEDALSGWHAAARTGKPGAPRTYSDMAIMCMGMLSAVYQWALRATQGLLASVLRLLKVALPVPHSTTLCRRRQKLAVSLPRRAQGEPLPVVVEATGSKGYGAGEWKVRRHGWSKRRTQAAKLHLGVDEVSGAIGAAAVTTNALGEGQRLPDLLAHIDAHIVQVSGDGAYDTHACDRAIDQRKARTAIPPRRAYLPAWQHKRPAEGRAMRTCGVSDASDVRRGGARVAIIVAAWRRRPYFGSRRSSVTECARVYSRLKAQNCSFAAAH
jgi:hypothetical protein